VSININVVEGKYWKDSSLIVSRGNLVDFKQDKDQLAI